MSDTTLPETLSVDNDHHDHHNRHPGDVGDGGDDASLLLTSPGEGMPTDDPVTTQWPGQAEQWLRNLGIL